MPNAQPMLENHPIGPGIDARLLAECIERCFDCAQVCTACADACLGESKVDSLVRCIRLNLDCADVCLTTGKLLSRLTGPNPKLIPVQLQVCAAACRLCGEECAMHALHHEHCRTCAEVCRACEESCNQVLSAFKQV